MIDLGLILTLRGDAMSEVSEIPCCSVGLASKVCNALGRQSPKHRVHPGGQTRDLNPQTRLLPGDMALTRGEVGGQRHQIRRF
jgi:hypothetical protein